MRKAILLICGILLLMAGVFVPLISILIVAILPETFAATARIVPAVTDPMAIATEVEKIRSQSILLPVVANLNLARKYAEKAKEEGEYPSEVAYAILRRNVEATRSKSASIIEVKVFSEDKLEAAVVANEIAAVYLKSPLAAQGVNTGAGPQLIEKATPALRPARPNKVRAFATASGMGLFLIVIGVVLIVAGLRRRDSIPAR